LATTQIVRHTTVGVKKSPDPLLPVTSRGYQIPRNLLPECHCDPYMRAQPEPGTNFSYFYAHHNGDCQQHRAYWVAIDLIRFSSICNGLYLYDQVDAEDYDAWRKRVKDNDSRFEENLAVWVNTGSKRAILTPFERHEGWGEPLAEGDLIRLASTAGQNWHYGQKERLLGWLGRVSYRDIINLRQQPPTCRKVYPLSRRFAQQCEIETAALEESLGCLGVGRATYEAKHQQECGECKAGGSCPDLLEDYAIAAMRFSDCLGALYEAFWKEVLAMAGLTSEMFGQLEKQLKKDTRAIKRQECCIRERELGLQPLPSLGQVAMPKDASKKVMQLARSQDDVDQQAALSIADASKEVLAEPFSRYQESRLGVPLETQKALAKLEVDAIIKYGLGRKRFEDAEALFLAEVDTILKKRKELSREKLSLWLDWRFPPNPPAVLELAA
jgi:hypothetical protein